MAADLERRLQELVDTRKIPNAILYACDATGDFSYHSVFGSSSPVPGSPPLTEDVYLWAASSTKLYISIAIMKLVEEGRLSLDDTVDALLPELAGLKILTNTQPPWEYKDPETKITYRQLLAHTSGLTYFFHHPHMIAWKMQNPTPGGDVPSRFGYPLNYEPGTAWEYSCGLDWAGLAVERIVGTTLCEYLQQILAPAGVATDDITFFPLDLPPSARVATMAQRNPEDGGFTPGDQGIPPLPAKGERFCYGGHGGFVRGGAPLKVLRSLLADDGKILGPEAAAEMLRAQLTPAQKDSINNGLMYTVPIFERTAAREVKRGTMDHSLCGNVDVEGQPWGRGRGTVMWGGAPNIKWFLDREKGLCGFFGAALLPSGDPTYVDIELEFEKAVYEMAGKVSPVS